MLQFFSVIDFLTVFLGEGEWIQERLWFDSEV